MIRTMGMLELRSIAKGIETADYMVKAAQVDLVYSKTICPGKYMIMISGDVGSVKEAIETGIEASGSYLVESFVLPSIHPDIIDGIRGVKKKFKLDAVGVFETTAVAAGVYAMDSALKSGQVSLIKVSLGAGIGGKCYFIVTGEVSSVTEALRAAENAVDNRKILEKVIIPNPSQELIKMI